MNEKFLITTATVGEKDEMVRCLDRTTGKEIWQQTWTGSLKVPFFAARNGSWIRATPTIDGDRLYVAGIRDVLVCFNLPDGKELWRFDAMKELGTAAPAFGCVCSPLVDTQGIYFQAGLTVCKLDKTTGKLLWKALKENDSMMGSAFSSPVLSELGGKEQIVVQTRSRLAGVDKDSGEVMWEKAIPTFRGMNILTPVTYENQVFTSTYGGNTRLIDISLKDKQMTTTDKWQLKYEGYMTTPVIVQDNAYWFGKDRRFISVNLKTGKENWRSEERFGEYCSLVVRNDKILALDMNGKLYLLNANPKEFEILDQTVVSKEETWAHLAVVDNQLYIRDLKKTKAFLWK
ncbi:MAG: PQQ-binding-like beta-propeller repeat protein [Zavarzinella sp.]